MLKSMMNAALLMPCWCLLATPAEALSTLILNKHLSPTNDGSFLQVGSGSTATKARLKWVERSSSTWSDSAPPVLGSIAPLNEDGYLSVVKLGMNSEMEVFIRRLVNKLNLDTRDEGAMGGLVPHFSGMRGSSTYFLLVQELVSIAAQENTWLVEKSSPVDFRSVRKQFYDVFMQFEVSHQSKYKTELNAMIDKAPLNQDGYEAVARLNSDSHMGRYVRRVLTEMGPFYIADEGRFLGTIKFYSGSKGGAVQSFARLRFEAIGGVRDFEPWLASGESVLLNENGYKAVAALKNDTEMATLVRRVAHHYGCSVVDDGGMMGVVPHYSGRISVQSLALLEQEVRDICGLTATATHVHYGNIHDVVGKDGVLQIRLPGSARYKYSAEELQSAGIVATKFSATNASTTPSLVLASTCPLHSDPDAAKICAQKEDEIQAPRGTLGEEPGCKTKVEQAIADSHRGALLAALKRQDEWTAIIEDDVVPLHPGFFDASFKEAWKKVPKTAKLVRLSWCSFEKDLGSIAKRTSENAGNFRLINTMDWEDEQGKSHYYTGGCTTGYIVHKSFVPELLGIFPCCCPMDCCMERQLFYAPALKHGPKTEFGFRGEQIMVNLDAWDSREESFNYTSFNQGGILVQDNRDLTSLRPAWNTED